MLLCNRLVISFWREMNWSRQSYFYLTSRFLILERNDLVMTIVIFIYFVLASIWNWQDLFLCSIQTIEDTISSNKTSIMIFGIKDKALCCENYLYCVYYC